MKWNSTIKNKLRTNRLGFYLTIDRSFSRRGGISHTRINVWSKQSDLCVMKSHAEMIFKRETRPSSCVTSVDWKVAIMSARLNQLSKYFDAGHHTKRRIVFFQLWSYLTRKSLSCEVWILYFFFVVWDARRIMKTT